jgi:nicotinate-nucleotide adenylyltransferase
VRLGILGGTFNPPHLGHLVCAQEAYLQLELDQVMLIPAREPPHKPVEDEPGVEHRLALCAVAVRDDDRFSVSDIEVTRSGPSFTVDTLEVLHARASDDHLFLILGGDAAIGLPQWREPQRLLSLATAVIAKRRGTPRAAVVRALAQIPGGERAEFFRMPRIAISSTMVRARVRAGMPISYIVPDPVAGYIEKHRLYEAHDA